MCIRDSIKSTGFTIQGQTDMVYFTDIPNKNNDGTLYTCEVMCNDDDGNVLISGITSVLVQE